jgi:dienelactone hydrolase
MRKSGTTIALTCLLLAHPVWAGEGKTVQANNHSGKVVTAELRMGKPSQPAAIIVHGFLQTRSFPTVATLTDALAGAGYTVLAPTLSLGIPKRNKSLPCEAVHTHTLNDDVAEIAFWVRWLTEAGHSNIVLIGHSFGSLQLLTYLGRKPLPAVKKALLISLTDVEVKQGAQERTQLARNLRERIARGDKSLVETEFGHCKKYVSSPPALLSYIALTRGDIVDALAKPPVPVEVIMGGNDDRMGRDWADKLAARGIAIHVIRGANHFFDNQYEFDLQDAVLQGIGSGKAGR